MESPERIDPKLVYLDPFLMDRARKDQGLSRKALSTKVKVAFNTTQEMFRSGGVQPATAKRLADALGVRVTEVLASWDPHYVPPASPSGPWSPIPEWETIGYLEQGRLAANGLYYIVCRMQHRHTPSRQGRGKFYHLSWMPQKLRKDIQVKLSRHPEVCARIGSHPQIALHLSSISAEPQGWWVIDDWCGEKSLSDVLEEGPYPRELLSRLLLEIANGLAAMHRSEIVFRELAPSRVLIADKNGRAVLTDFELAKLLDGSPSVSSDWPEDPFRAPEIDGGTATIRSDLYSLGALTAAAIAGRTPAAGEAKAILSDAGLPKRLGNLLRKCVEPIPDRRPEGLSPLLRELERWAKG
ncbi:protein kinase domain-containing protein [Planctomicrobium sp. SH527]|uniref:protein kinase domain-containing protein n=1 Tax=Planctomicrobium sp. SH527 TaxID=3448123 RepID=UPI003F5C8FE6